MDQRAIDDQQVSESSHFVTVAMRQIYPLGPIKTTLSHMTAFCVYHTE